VSDMSWCQMLPGQDGEREVGDGGGRLAGRRVMAISYTSRPSTELHEHFSGNNVLLETMCFRKLP
ncbi:hypothetical protein Droror1_Dr00024155, partial [Drosera rotundifolia]